MIIRCWGARGSIPVSGREYLKYGGDTTCVEIITVDDEVIILDAGTGIRRLGNKLLSENRFSYNIIFTHAHWDHILGFPFFKPIYREGVHINMFGCISAYDSIRHMISRTMAVPNFPVKFEDVKADFSYPEACENGFSIKSVSVTPIKLSHPNQSYGYKFIEGDKCFVFMTDNELAFQHPDSLAYKEYEKFVAGADLIMHDAEYTAEEYRTKMTWGHSSYKDVMKMAMAAGVKKIGLFHHNQERTDDEIDGIVEGCRKAISESSSGMECFAVAEDMEIVL